ncbi:MAG: 6,7-dimethyl-8-ribityllumazine synthase [Acidimicrobiales bacterium]
MPARERLDDVEVRVGIVCSSFHTALTEALRAGALGYLAGAGLPEDRVDMHWVPGSFEVPQAARMLAGSGRYAAIVAVGAVIRGATAHFDHVSMAVSQGLIRVGLDTGIPCTFGVLTCDSLEQAWARAGGDVGNAGEDAARAAVSLMNLTGLTGSGPQAASSPRA